MSNPLQLSHENYYSQEAGRVYMSNSQLKVWGRCEAKAHAQFVTGEWVPKSRACFEVGKYVDAGVLQPDGWADDMARILHDHNGVFYKQDGSEKADKVRADKMISRALDDEVAQEWLAGDQQVILVGEIGGMKWKAMLDVLNLALGWICDFKTTRSLGKVWAYRDGRRRYMPWYDQFGYLRQLAVYRELVRQVYGVLCEVGLCGVLNDDVPWCDVLRFGGGIDEVLDAHMKVVELECERVLEIRAGASPIHCAEVLTCEFCRSQTRATEARVMDVCEYDWPI